MQRSRQPRYIDRADGARQTTCDDGEDSESLKPLDVVIQNQTSDARDDHSANLDTPAGPK